MTKHYNTSIIEDANRILNTKGNDNLLNDVNPIIQPVIPITRVCNVTASGAATNATSATVYTTPSDKDFYLVGCSLSVCKDVTSTSTISSLRCAINGLFSDIIDIACLTLTVQNEAITISFPFPIKVDRATIISVTNTTNVANVRSIGSIIGYTVETTKGV